MHVFPVAFCGVLHVWLTF